MTEETDNNNTVHSFKEKQLMKNAKEFVDAYEDGGMNKAVMYARLHIGAENYKQLRPLVQKEFKDRGYEIVPVA